ncbi:hypothetical protein BDK51DRAFT_34473, partial [Blyttiomyces helicus]
PWPPLNLPTVSALHLTQDRTLKSLTYAQFAIIFTRVHALKDVFLARDNHVDELEFGFIARERLRKALVGAGVTVSEKFLKAFMEKLRKSDTPVGWDDFVHYVARMQLLTDVFQKIDMDRDRYITVSWNQFLDLVTDCGI